MKLHRHRNLATVRSERASQAATFPAADGKAEASSVTRPKILVVVRHPVGGIRTYLSYTLASAEFESFEIHLVLPDGEETDVLDETLSGRDVTFEKTADSTTSLGLAAFRKILSTRYALIHAHGFTAAVCTAFARLAALSSCNFIITPHDMILPGQFRGATGAMKRLCLALAIKRASRLVVVSEAARKNIMNAFPALRLHPERLQVVPTGIDSERFASGSVVDLRRDLELPAEAFLVGFFGRFMAPKGFATLVEAVSRLAQSRQARPVYVVAVGGGGFIDREKRHINAIGINRYFRFIGFAPDIRNYLKSVDLVVMPSRWETGPVLPKEVLVAGTPIISSDCAACAEIARETPMRTFPVGDAGALADSIRAETENSSKAEFAAFAETAADRYDARETAKAIAEIYRDFTDRDRA